MIGWDTRRICFSIAVRRWIEHASRRKLVRWTIILFTSTPSAFGQSETLEGTSEARLTNESERRDTSPEIEDHPEENVCVPSCRSGYLCHEGSCISACNPPCSESETCSSDGACRSRASSQDKNESHVPSDGHPERMNRQTPSGWANVHVNALGLLQFGLNPRLELGRKTTFLLGTHFFNSGALSYVLLPGDDEFFDLGIGGNVGLRHYLGRDGPIGAYLGVFLEYAFVRTVDDVDDLASYERQVLIPAVDVGYRWTWGNFLLDVGALVGVGVPFAGNDVPLGPSGCVYEDSCNVELGTRFFATGIVDVGFFF